MRYIANACVSIHLILWISQINAQPPAPANPAPKPAAKTAPSPTTKAAPLAAQTSPPKEKETETETDKFVAGAADAVDKIEYVSAEIRQVVRVADQEIPAKGIYKKGPGYRTRLELEVGLDDLISRRLRISDGTTGYFYEKILETERVDKLDVGQVMALIERKEMPLEIRQQLLLQLPVLRPGEMMRGFLKTLTFSRKAAGYLGENKVPVIVVEGHWKKDSVVALLGNPAVESIDDLGGNIPQYVRLYLEEKSKWPLRIEMFRRDATAEYKPIFTLEFQKFAIVDSIPEQEFQWTPPPKVTPRDLTAEIVRSLGSLKDKAGAAPAAKPAGGAVSGKIERPSAAPKAKQ